MCLHLPGALILAPPEIQQHAQPSISARDAISSSMVLCSAGTMGPTADAWGIFVLTRAVHFIIPVVCCFPAILADMISASHARKLWHP